MLLTSNLKAALRDCGIMRQTRPMAMHPFAASMQLENFFFPQILACSGVADVSLQKDESIAIHFIPQLFSLLKTHSNTPNPEAAPSQDEGIALLRDE